MKHAKLILKIILVLLLLVFSAEAFTEKPDRQLQAKKCIAANIFFEARNQGLAGMQAVADVTINRAKSKKYPSDICAVVFQKMQFSWTHQVSNRKIQNALIGSTKGLQEKDKEAMKLAHELADRTLFEGSAVLLPDTVLHYHADYVKPKWARKMQRYTKIVNHWFYIDKTKV